MNTLTKAAQDVLAERARQVNAEGWTPDHDDEHDTGELAIAAACYAAHTGVDVAAHHPGPKTDPAYWRLSRAQEFVRSMWPWGAKWWKPKDRRRNLVRAAALLLAEIERLDRAADAPGVEAAPAPQPTPYGLAGIDGDAIVIRLTADACAFAFANDPQAREPRPPVINKQQFLRDTLNELTAEREDGSTPLTDMLDRAMVKAMENGSDALDHDAAGVTAQCWCLTCRPQGFDRMEMVVCPDCGCKRCPHAENHANACTGRMVPTNAPNGMAHTCSGCEEARARLAAAVTAAGVMGTDSSVPPSEKT